MPEFEEVGAELEQDMTREAAEPWLAMVADYFHDTRSGDGPVSSSSTAEEVAERLAGPMPMHGRPMEDVAARLASLMLGDMNRLAHPMAMGHQVAPPLPAAVWTESLIAAYNQSVAVREMSPAFTPLERQVIRWCTDLVGWGAEAGGTMTSGGTEATFAALLAARSAAIPDVWTDGVGANPPVLVCGEHAHYAVARAAGAMGLGLAQVVVIPSRGYRMDTELLDARLGELRAAGARVMAVVATSGCTATGSFDDLEAIADLCAKHGDAGTGDLWLHVDAAHGGTAMMVPDHAHRMRGISRARSLAWDPHKTLLLPLPASMVLVRDERDLDGAFAQKAPYLFGTRAEARTWDIGPRSFMCSRRADVLKLWVALERYGAIGLAAIYARLCDTTRAMYDALAAHPTFTPLHEPQSNILCFTYDGYDDRAPAERDALTSALRERYNASGEGWITATTLDGRRVLRVTVMNPRTTADHVRRVVDGLVRCAGETD